MADFNYIDIFATKGFEYLLVIGFFLVFTGFWSFLNRPRKEIREARAEREELQRLLHAQQERMTAEIEQLREQRDGMHYALLSQFQSVEQRAIAAWQEEHPGEHAPSDIGKLVDWILAERRVLAEDKQRIDYLSELTQWKPTLYRTGEASAAVIVEAGDHVSGTGVTLRDAIDAAKKKRAA